MICSVKLDQTGDARRVRTKGRTALQDPRMLVVYVQFYQSLLLRNMVPDLIPEFGGQLVEEGESPFFLGSFSWNLDPWGLLQEVAKSNGPRWRRRSHCE